MNGQEPFNRPQKGNGPEEKPRGPFRVRGMFGWLLIITIAVILAMLLRSVGQRASPLEISEFHDILTSTGRQGEIKMAWFDGDVVYGIWSGGMADGRSSTFYVQLTLDLMPEYTKLMRESLGKNFANEKQQSITKPNPFLQEMLIWMVVPLLGFGLLWFFFLRQMRGAGGPGGVLTFGRTRARMTSKEEVKVTFKDVAGIEEAKEDVREIIEFLKNAAKFECLGARIPRGVLLIGPPGTGKTLLAKAIAGEANVPFFSISGSDFVEMFVGVGASRVRDLFRQAKEHSPCIIFLDEVDAVGRKRGMGYTGGHDEREQTLNAILVEMDGFDTNEQVILIAATNRPDILDPALRRPGRFDREVVINLPDLNERLAILKVHAKNVTLAPDTNMMQVARGTPGFSGADLAAIINEGALAATMKDKKHVELDDLEEARDKVRWGRAKRSRVMDEADKRIGAYHEAGHALMSLLLQPDVEPLHKVSIIPRGMALGATMFLPEKDRLLMKRRECIGNIKISLAGRLSEELFCGDISSGAANDIRQGTELARRMVMEWGMSEKLGPIRYSAFDEAGAMWPAELGGSKEHSDATAREIDEEIRCIFDECYQDARRLLTENGEKLKRIAEALLQYEVLDADDVRKAIEGELIDRPSPEEVKSSAESAEADEQEPEAAPVDASQEEAGPADDQAGLGPEGEGARAPEGPE